MVCGKITVTSEPHPHTNHESDLTRIAALLTDQRRRLTKTTVERQTDIRGELPTNLIAQPHAELQIVQSGSRCKFFDSLDRRIGLNAALPDQPLREQKIFAV